MHDILFQQTDNRESERKKVRERETAGIEQNAKARRQRYEIMCIVHNWWYAKFHWTGILFRLLASLSYIHRCIHVCVCVCESVEFGNSFIIILLSIAMTENSTDKHWKWNIICECLSFSRQRLKDCTCNWNQMPNSKSSVYNAQWWYHHISDVCITRCIQWLFHQISLIISHFLHLPISLPRSSSHLGVLLNLHSPHPSPIFKAFCALWAEQNSISQSSTWILPIAHSLSINPANIRFSTELFSFRLW